MNRPAPADRRGFTLIEMTIALVVGLVVLASATSFVVSTFRAQAGADMREEISRNARFLGEMLQRDIADAGVDLPSTTVFGSVDVRNDTVSVLRVPYTPTAAPKYTFEPPALPAGSSVPPNCGATCITVRTNPAGSALQLQAGDLVRLQSANVRRLILVQNITAGAGADLFNVRFANIDSILHRASVPAGGLMLDRAGTTVQKLLPIVFWRQGNQFMRATGMDPVTAAVGPPRRLDLLGDPLLDSVRTLTASLIFTDGHEANTVSGTDADATNNYDQIVSIRIQGTLASISRNPRVNGGQPTLRQFDWRFSPRNLRYERNAP